MSDILADRFFAVADLADDGDWRDVRRRTRRGPRRWPATVLVVAAAAVVATVAVAANGGWIFTRSASAEPSFSRTFSFQGSAWRLAGYLSGNGRIACFRLGPAKSASSGPRRCRVGLEWPGFVAPTVTPVGYDHGKGQIWFGDAQARVARVEITDTLNRIEKAVTLRTPTLPHPTARYGLWFATLPSSTARRITAYDRHGKLVYSEFPHLGSVPEATNVH
jgi:hypothetical protein